MSGANAHPLVDAAQQFFQKKKKEAAALERACTKPSMREFREMLTSIAFLRAAASRAPRIVFLEKTRGAAAADADRLPREDARRRELSPWRCPRVSEVSRTPGVSSWGSWRVSSRSS